MTADLSDPNIVVQHIDPAERGNAGLYYRGDVVIARYAPDGPPRRCNHS